MMGLDSLKNNVVNDMILIEALKEELIRVDRFKSLKKCNTEQFFLSFGDFVISILKNRIKNKKFDVFNNKYREWIENRIQEVGYYGAVVTTVEDRLIKDYFLVIDIFNNGIFDPIEILVKNNELIDINGYHRLIICEKLGHKLIKFSWVER